MYLRSLNFAPGELPLEFGYVGLPAAALVLLPGMSNGGGSGGEAGYRALNARALYPELECKPYRPSWMAAIRS